MATAELMESEQTQAFLLASLKSLRDNNQALQAELAAATPGGATSLTLDIELDSDLQAVFNSGHSPLQEMAMFTQMIRELRAIRDYLKPKPPQAVEVTPVAKPES